MTVQDGGRWGYQHLGVPVGGALDMEALHRANALVGNAANEAALEVTLVGCTLQAETRLHVAVTGARFGLRVNGVGAPPDVALTLSPGDALVLDERRSGARAYVAVRGGLDVPVVLGSRSAWPLLPRRGALEDGTRLPIGRRAIGPLRGGALPTPPPVAVLRVLPGPEASSAPAAVTALCAATYRVTPVASRMAYPLEGPGVPLAGARAPIERDRDRRLADPALRAAHAADGRAADHGRLPGGGHRDQRRSHARGPARAGRRGPLRLVSHAEALRALSAGGRARERA